MTDVVVDTNVPIVANDRDGEYPEGCPIACIERLREIREKDRVVIDLDWEILREYGRNLKSDGQPGVGDAFYQHILRHAGNEVQTRLVILSRDAAGNFVDFPADPRLENFDNSDRKFVAAARVAGCNVVNAVDSDWWEHEVELGEHGVAVDFVCGRDAATRIGGP